MPSGRHAHGCLLVVPLDGIAPPLVALGLDFVDGAIGARLLVLHAVAHLQNHRADVNRSPRSSGLARWKAEEMAVMMVAIKLLHLWFLAFHFTPENMTYFCPKGRFVACLATGHLGTHTPCVGGCQLRTKIRRITD